MISRYQTHTKTLQPILWISSGIHHIKMTLLLTTGSIPPLGRQESEQEELLLVAGGCTEQFHWVGAGWRSRLDLGMENPHNSPEHRNICDPSFGRGATP